MFISFCLKLTTSVFALTLACCAVAHADNKASIHIDKDTVIVVPPDAPEPIQRSVQDLVHDMTAVFGVAPRLTHQAGT